MEKTNRKVEVMARAVSTFTALRRIDRDKDTYGAECKIYVQNVRDQDHWQLSQEKRSENACAAVGMKVGLGRGATSTTRSPAACWCLS